MRRPLIAGNWKMNGSRESVSQLLQNLRNGCEHIEKAELAVFPPFVFLEQTLQMLMKTQIAWGAQTMSEHTSGAYTGEISASMLLDMHCSYVILGHSERRALYHETNEQVAAKSQVAIEAGLCPIICVGETEAEREAGKTLEVVGEQLEVILRLADNHITLEDVVIAYEPVWAIGTGKHATPAQAQEVHADIRSQFNRLGSELANQVRILYGGSVKPDNAEELFAMPDIDGALVGGASLSAEQFLQIAKLV